MKRNAPDDHQLVAFSDEHLLYEVQMLYESAAVVDKVNDWVFRMAALEAFVVHLRKTQRPQKTPLLEQSHKRAHKEVAHLTYARMAVTPEEKPWNCAEILKDVTPVLSSFVRLSPRSKIGSGLVSAVTQLMSHVPERSSANPPWAISTSAAGLTHTFDPRLG